MTPMSEERQQCILMMQNMGWTAQKQGNRWRFARPDTYGLLDVIYRNQSNINFVAIADIAMLSDDADQLKSHIRQAKLLWVKERFKGITNAK